MPFIKSLHNDIFQGKSNDKVGFFPAKYVHRLGATEKVLQVQSGLEVSEGGQSVKLLKDQVNKITGSWIVTVIHLLQQPPLYIVYNIERRLSEQVNYSDDLGAREQNYTNVLPQMDVV